LPDGAKRRRLETYTRTTFKSNDRFGGYETLVEQPEGIKRLLARQLKEEEEEVIAIRIDLMLLTQCHLG
jgi:hypothetical protein